MVSTGPNGSEDPALISENRGYRGNVQEVDPPYQRWSGCQVAKTETGVRSHANYVTGSPAYDFAFPLDRNKPTTPTIQPLKSAHNSAAEISDSAFEIPRFDGARNFQIWKESLGNWRKEKPYFCLGKGLEIRSWTRLWKRRVSIVDR